MNDEKFEAGSSLARRESAPEPVLTYEEFSDELKRALSHVQTEVNIEAGRTRTELNGELGKAREELHAELSRTRNDLNEGLSLAREGMGEELSRVRVELNTESRLTREELHAALSRTRSELNEALSMTRQELIKESSRLTRKDWLQIVVMPLTFVVVAAILGTYFQDRSFTKNTLFQTQYERLLSAQRETVTQYQDLNSVLNTLKRWEEISKNNPTYCSAENFTPPIEQLKQFDNRSLALKDYSKESGANNVLDAALNNYSQKIKEAIKCESGFVLNGCKGSCDQSATELRAALQESIYKHNDVINDLIRQSK